MKITAETVDLMLRCWAEWSLTGQGGTPWDDTPRDAIYTGAEPIPDTPMLIEQCLSELRQATVGVWYEQFIRVHYFNFNKPTLTKLNLMRQELGRRVTKAEFYDSARTGKVLVMYELQQIDERGQRPHKSIRKRKLTVDKKNQG